MDPKHYHYRKPEWVNRDPQDPPGLDELQELITPTDPDLYAHDRACGCPNCEGQPEDWETELAEPEYGMPEYHDWLTYELGDIPPGIGI